METEGHQVLDTAVVNVLNVSSFGEVLHIGGAVEHGVDLRERLQGLRLGNVSRDGPDARSQELAVVFLEVIHQHFAQAALRGNAALGPEQAPDGGVRPGALDEFLEHVDAQEARGAGEQDIASQVEVFPAQEGFQRVFGEQGVDGGVVVVRNVAVLLLYRYLAREEGRKGAGRRVREHVRIGKVQALFLRAHHHVGDHERGTSQVEEGVRGAHALHAQDIGKDGAKGFLRFADGCDVLVHGGGNELRQGLAVYLLVHIERNLVQLHPGGGHHVGRLALADEVAGGFGVEGAFRHHIRSQELAAGRGVQRLHRDVFHARELLQHALSSMRKPRILT